MKLIILLVTVFCLCSCKTWEGIKEDTREVGGAIGEAMQDIGETIEESTE